MEQKSIITVPEYTSYPKRFSPYKWYKPLLVILIFFGFYLASTIILSIISVVAALLQGVDLLKMVSGGYDTMDTYTPLGAFISLGSVAVLLPLVLAANRIINSRPFSSYSSSRGGFSFSVFAKCFVGALVIAGIPLVVLTLLVESPSGNVKFTVLGFIFCLVLGPLQCVAEEYVFRGLFMQAFGSWIKFPIISVILQSLIFTALHPYDIVGIILIFLMGLTLGFCATVSKGLEAGSALHIVNNMTAFFFTGFGYGAVSSTVDWISFTVTVCFCAVYLGFIIFADKKLGWFNKIKKDDVTAFNNKIAEKKMKSIPQPVAENVSEIN